MEKINYRFLNYKHYNTFKQDLTNGRIRQDAIVFIQDKLRIWARGKEYICNGVDSTQLNDSTLTFKDALGNNVFTLNIDGNLLNITDTAGNVYSKQIVIPDDLTGIRNRITALEQSDINLSDRINSKQDRLVFDSEINEESANAVENRAIAEELKNYVQNAALLQALRGKQDNLVLGNGLAFNNGTLEITLDTQTFVIVDQLPEDPNPNKIYMVYTQEEGETKYYSYRWNGTEWVPMGDQTPKVDLSEYLKTADADSKYTTPASVTESISELYELINNTFQKKANYAQVGYLNQRLEDLQRIIDEKYVLKKDVYTPGKTWSSSDVVSMGDTTVVNTGSTGTSSSGGKNMVTLTEARYQWLVGVGAIDPSTYYFTYEGEEETNNWTFGGTFPIIFGESGVGTFPITLT